MNPLRSIVAINSLKVTLECGHFIIMIHGNIPAIGAKKHCVLCGHSQNKEQQT